MSKSIAIFHNDVFVFRNARRSKTGGYDDQAARHYFAERVSRASIRRFIRLLGNSQAEFSTHTCRICGGLTYIIKWYRSGG